MTFNIPHMPPHHSQHLTHPKYRADIDGLRAIAVLSVIGFHAFPFWVKGGFIGVDIFFVISGFLISTIIMGSLERNSFSFIEFYIRRIKRIFPALLLVLIATLVFGWFALLPDEYKQLGKHIAGGAGFVSNFVLWYESGYFDNAAETKPLLHLWTLGVEEQYYIIWPLLLWAAWKLRVNLLTIAIAVGVISFALNVGQVRSDAVAAFYSPQTRFWELMIGSILAYMTRHNQNIFPKFKHRLDMWLGKVFYAQAPEANGKTLRNVQSVFGAVLIVIGVIVITKEKSFPGWWAVLPTAGAVLIISAGAQAWVNRAVLSNRVLVWFGLISFPLYLWHWPLLSFARIMESEVPSREIRIFAVAISIMLAWLTYELIEKSIRFGKHSKAKAFTLLVLMIVVGSAGYYIYRADGLGLRYAKIDENANQLKWDNASVEGGCRQKYPNGPTCAQMTPQEPTVLLVGDSHALALFPGLAYAYRNTNENVVFLGLGACPPFYDTAAYSAGTDRNRCLGMSNDVLSLAEQSNTVKTIVMTFRGPLYTTSSGFIENNPGLILRWDGDPKYANNADYHNDADVFRGSFRHTLSRLSATHKKIIFVLDNPELDFLPGSCLDTRPVRLTSHIKSPCAIPREVFEERSKSFREIALSTLKDFPAIQVVDSANYLCDEKYCWAMKDGKMLYRDSDHLSIEGAKFIASKFVSNEK